MQVSYLTAPHRHSAGNKDRFIHLQNTNNFFKSISRAIDFFFHNSLFLRVYTHTSPPSLSGEKINRVHNLLSLRFLFNIYLLGTLLIAMSLELFAGPCDNGRQTKEYWGGRGSWCAVRRGYMEWRPPHPILWRTCSTEPSLRCLLLICLCPCSDPYPDSSPIRYTYMQREKKRLIKKPK